jgi:hypothetical protein
MGFWGLSALSAMLLLVYNSYSGGYASLIPAFDYVMCVLTYVSLRFPLAARLGRVPKSFL